MIPKPQRDDEGKVQGEFYPLQKAELVALRKAKLINNAAFVHLALRYENPWCDRKITVIPKEFGMRWQMPESSVYEAIAKLKEASAINIKSGKITIEWAYSQQEDNSENPENFWKSRNDSENPEKILESQKKLRNPRKNSGSSENRRSKPSPGKDSSSLQTIQTYSDFIQTLSEEERANFLNFCEEKTKNLSQEVNDIEAWLAHTTKAGKNRWEVYYEKYLAAKQVQVKKTATKSALLEFRQELEEQQRQAQKAWLESQNQKELENTGGVT